ncbi:MAG: MFS transporter [Caldilineaceae bacterium]|nr:MFS transporter [Caldilineaceae bacterium]
MNPKRLSAISIGHFAIDILNSSIAMILASLAGQFDLSYSQVGFAVMIYTFAGALSQPLFGLLADRLRGRWLGAAGLLWVMFFYALIPFAPNYATLVVLLTVGAFGSGAFHPVGMVNAADAGGHRPATATSIFFLFGQTGLALGPTISGIILQRMGLAGLPYLALAMTPAVVMMLVYLREPVHYDATAPSAGASGETQKSSNRAAGWTIAIAFTLLILLRSTTLQSYMILLPQYFNGLGYSPATYGVMVSVFTFAGALGTFSGGYFGDRTNRRHLIFWAMLVSVPFSLLLLRTSGLAYFVTASLSGALLSIPHSILIVMAQRFLPARRGMIGGAVLGFMFASGAVGTWLASWAADYIGLGTVLSILAFVPIGAGICALFLPSTRQVSPMTQSTPAQAAAD